MFFIRILRKCFTKNTRHTDLCPSFPDFPSSWLFRVFSVNWVCWHWVESQIKHCCLQTNNIFTNQSIRFEPIIFNASHILFLRWVGLNENGWDSIRNFCLLLKNVAILAFIDISLSMHTFISLKWNYDLERKILKIFCIGMIDKTIYFCINDFNLLWENSV